MLTATFKGYFLKSVSLAMAVFGVGGFGARYEGHNRYIELQIWRPTGNGVYTKVGYTTIDATEEANLYEYSSLLSPGLPSWRCSRVLPASDFPESVETMV